MKAILWLCVLLLGFVGPPSQVWAQTVTTQTGGQPSSIPQLDAEQARQRVIEIVNQPITHVPRTSEAAQYNDGWFHPGAIKPDFDTVDIRTTQQLIYNGYVTSNLNPTEMFIGQELEFNANTKYFYVDRTLPKKRLSEAEMIEINSLYRIIGRAEDAPMEQLKHMALLVLCFCVVVAVLFPALLLLTRRRADAKP